MRYIVIGKETGTNGTPHLQGYVEMTNAVRLSSLKKMCERAHWEPRKGTPAQAAEYCKKDGNYWESGELPNQGARNDLKEVAEQVRSGVSLAKVAEENPGMWVKYHKGFRDLKMSLLKDRTERPTVIWLWGGTGVGKTRTAVEKSSSFYIKDGTHWWDGYEQQETIIIDDFDGKWPFRDLLRLLDRYPYRGQYKGGYVNVNSPYIYITCEFHPCVLWSGTSLTQITRRLTEIKHLVSDTEVADTEVDG